MYHVTTRAILFAVTALTTSLATGCVPAESDEETMEENIGEAENAIIGGTLDTTTSRVVSIQVPLNGKRVHWCTGYVVAPRAVMTAAHCVCDDYSSSKFTFHNASSALSTEPMTEKDTGATLKVKETVLMNNSCASGWDGTDIALLVLNKPVDVKGIKPGFTTKFYSFDTNPGAKKFDVYGYGRTVSDVKSPGIRKKVQVEFDESPSAFKFLTHPFKQNGKFKGTLCDGDSGAPIFLSGGRYAGVHSAGAALCQNSDAGYHVNTRLVSTNASDKRMKKITEKLTSLAQEEAEIADLRRLRPDCEGDGTYSSTEVKAVSPEHANELYDCPDGSNPKSWFDAGSVTGACNGCPSGVGLGNDTP
jgi:secreted trypsin-like serine protease